MRSKQQLYDRTRTTRDTIDERDRQWGRLKDYQDGSVEMMWGWNEAVTRDQIFKLRKGKTTIILDKEELMKYLRWV